MKSLGFFEDFCDHLIRKYGDPISSTEDQKAEEFRRRYLRDLPINQKSIMAITSCLDIKLKGLERMPRNVRGYHEICGGEKCLYYRLDDTPSGIQNTILHEIREMMETLFARVKPDYTPLKTSARHIAANRFASAVLLPEEKFRDRAFETGLDVVALSQMFSKSHAQILLRIGEVLQGRLFFYGALYEPDDAEGEDWAVTYWTGSQNGETKPGLFDMGGPFPKKGMRALPGSLVDMAVKTRMPHLSGKITLNRAWNFNDEGFIALAQPILETGTGVEKVALIVMKASDRGLLKPQIDSTKPITLEDIPASFGG